MRRADRFVASQQRRHCIKASLRHHLHRLENRRRRLLTLQINGLFGSIKYGPFRTIKHWSSSTVSAVCIDSGDRSADTSAWEWRAESVPSAGQPSSEDESNVVRQLEASGRYRVLRQIPRSRAIEPQAMPLTDTAVGLAIAIETTSLEPDSAEVVGLAMLRFLYSKTDGCILGELGRFHAWQQPSKPLSPEVIRVTELGDAALAGHLIDAAEVERFVRDDRVVVIAYHAGFDRPVLERHFPVFRVMCWACSMEDVPWAWEGYEGTKLSHLVLQVGFFHADHRATEHAEALLHLLSLPLPVSRETALAALLRHARRPRIRVWANGAPYSARALLRRRTYRWSAGADRAPRAWYRDVAADDAAAEIRFLRSQVLRAPDFMPILAPLRACDRFAGRAGMPS